MLFNKFTDTIFLKDDSNLEKQYEALTKLNQEYPNNKQIEEELYFIKKGIEGEKEIKYQLSKANIGMFVLHDINFEYNDLKAQVDYIVVTKAHCYFIECKNLVGNITVDSNGNFIREYSVNGRKIRKGMDSPIRQVEAQRIVYKKLWDTFTFTNNKIINGLTKILGNRNFDSQHRILVVAANSDTIIDTKHAPNDIKDKIIRADALIRKIQYDIDHSDKSLWSPKSETESWANMFLSESIERNYDYYEIFKNKYINNTIRMNDEKLRECLIKFRNNRANEKGIPLHYVFSDKELDTLVEIKPKTIEELQQGKILYPDTKVNLHGEAIINLINRK